MFGDQARPEVTRFVTFGLRNGDPEKVKGRRSALSSGTEPWDQRHSFGAKFAGTVAAVAPAIAATPRAVAVATPTEWPHDTQVSAGDEHLLAPGVWVGLDR